MSDLKSIVFDEIALEGLDGITIDTLWIRLLHRTDLQFNLDHLSSKTYIWKHIVLKFASSNFKFYTLPHDRPPLQYYNRYELISHETGYCLNNEDRVPDDIYADICPIYETEARGSCKYYKERKIVFLDDLKEFNLKQISEKFGNKLIIVANQILRDTALRINYNDPQIELSPIQYCILERVGRGRYSGEITFGKESGNFKDPPKTLFYFRKLLLKKGLITKQVHTVYNTKTQTITRGLLLMLPRFHIERKSPIEMAANRIFEILKVQPDLKCDYHILRSKVNMKPKLFKHVFAEFHRNFRVFDRGTEKSSRKNLKRCVELVKNLYDDDDDCESISDENDEPEEDKQMINSDTTKVKLFSPVNIVVNRPLLSQSYNIVESYSVLNGCSLREFQSEIILPRLDVRMLIRMLERLNEITTITTNIGRQKIIRYFLKSQSNQAVTKFNNENNQLDLGKKTTLITLKRANLILNAVKEHKIIDQLVYFKKIILEAEKNLPYLVDQKSIKTIISTLAQEGHLKWIQHKMEKNDFVRDYHLVCVPSIREDDEIIKERIEQAKFNFASVINQDSTEGRNENASSNKNQFGEWFTNSKIDEIELVYQPSAGRKYGLEPKMKKLLTFYKFLFFTMSDECRKDNKYNDWRRHITPLPKSYEKGTCLLGDLIPRMPLSTFVKVVFITFIIPGLDELLKDPVRRNYTLQMLPTDIVRNLFRKRKYIFSMVELLTSLTYLNLVKLNNQQQHLRESVEIKLLTTTQFVEDDYVKNYRLENFEDVKLFASDLTLHGSRTDCKKCSFDSRLYIHNARNWSYLPKLHRNLQIKEIRRFERLRNVIENDNVSDAQTLNSKHFNHQSSKRKSTSKKQDRVNKRRKVINENNEKVHSISKSISMDRSKNLKGAEILKKPRSKSYDKEDMNALSLLRKQRSEWSKEEDSFLLMCRVASVLLHPTSFNFVCVSKRIIRDELNKYLPKLAFDKTSTACQRRIMYMLKNPRTRAHVQDWVAECKQNPELSAIKKPSVPLTHEQEWNSSYIDILHKLLKKFQNENFIRPSNAVEYFKTLDEIYKKYNLIESEIHCVPQKPVLYFQPNNIVDIYVNVVLNVIASSLLTNLFDNSEDYNTKSTLALFKIYQRYPDVMIRSVVNKMKQNGMMAKMKDLDHFKIRNRNKKLSMFKISQHYCFVLKSRYSMDTLAAPIQIMDDFQIDHFNSTQTALLTGLMSLDRTQFSIAIPENFISYREPHLANKISLTKDHNNNLINEQTSTQNSLNETSIDQTNFANWNKRASRFVLCSLRQKMNLDAKSNQTDQEFLVLNSVNVTCKITSSKGLVDLADFFELMEKQNTFVDMNADHLNNIDLNVLERQIIKEVLKTKELGLNFKQLKESLKSKQIEESLLNSTIQKMCDQQVLFKVGVDELRLVTHKFINPWLVHVQIPLDESVNEESNAITDAKDKTFDSAMMNTSEKDLNADQATQSNQTPMEIDENNATSQICDQQTSASELPNCSDYDLLSKQKQIDLAAVKPSQLIHYQPKFWKNPFGELDKRVMVIFLSGILGHIMANPGITNEDLISYFKFCLPPVQTNELIDLLVAAKCVDKCEQIVESNYTLFGDYDDQTLIYYEPTKQAFVSICAIKYFLENTF